MQVIENLLRSVLVVLIVGFIACWRLLRRIEDGQSKITYSAEAISENITDISSAVGNIEHDLRPKDLHNTQPD
jgi:hypothetical protein